MYSHPIGILDSGIGGFSTCIELQKKLPKENIIYYGDLLHMPYGKKSEDYLLDRISKICQFLQEQNCKAIVIACNTASAVYIKNKDFFKNITIPIFDVITSTVSLLEKMNYSNITILATQTAINSGVYEKLLLEHLPNTTVKSFAAIEWASLIETIDISSQKMLDEIKLYTQKITNTPENCVLLACTHYYFIQEIIQQELDRCPIVSSSIPVIDIIENTISLSKELKDSKVFTSEDSYVFSNYAKQVFGNKINKVEIETL